MEQGVPRGQGKGPSWSLCTPPRPHSSTLEFPPKQSQVHCKGLPS